MTIQEIFHSNIFSNNPTWAIGSVIIMFGIFANHRLQTYRDKKTIFNKVAKEFTDTFCRELKEIYTHPVKWPDNINYYLNSRIDNLKEVTGKLRHHLPWWKRYFFDKTWFRFYCCTGREIDKDCQVYHHYMPFK
ncbi:MAG: hypothetical protein HW390_2655, partial [Candidatus Brocadiaceae bacterium]|nr:hypothetical protein [Candidatus Brocadiaceae bacterium]